ncbi:MAG: tRNA (guanosine(46)-N7)-methyltransferase TrmB [Bacteroidota bacterium]|nr:tRNA (guanosine(46)-N7)-methyltransferase TrmB [Bacteroidota bacterium]
MGKNKLERFAENETFEHFFQPSFDDLMQGFPLKGKWNPDFFGNDNPIVLELGCGKGEYTVNLASKYPDVNFIGLDKKGARLWRGGKTSKENKMRNVAFIRTRIEQIEHLFGPAEVSAIWITFPEPQPRNSKAKKRFTSPQYIERFRKIIKPDGIIHLKTDSDLFFEYTLEVIKENGYKLLYSNPDLYEYPDDPRIKDVIAVQTFYEKMWLAEGCKIKYLEYKI